MDMRGGKNTPKTSKMLRWFLRVCDEELASLALAALKLQLLYPRDAQNN